MRLLPDTSLTLNMLIYIYLWWLIVWVKVGQGACGGGCFRNRALVVRFLPSCYFLYHRRSYRLQNLTFIVYGVLFTQYTQCELVTVHWCGPGSHASKRMLVVYPYLPPTISRFRSTGLSPRL